MSASRPCAQLTKLPVKNQRRRLKPFRKRAPCTRLTMPTKQALIVLKSGPLHHFFQECSAWCLVHPSFKDDKPVNAYQVRGGFMNSFMLFLPENPMIWVLIVGVVFLLFGGSKLPQLAKALGQSK